MTTTAIDRDAARAKRIRLQRRSCCTPETLPCVACTELESDIFAALCAVRGEEQRNADLLTAAAESRAGWHQTLADTIAGPGWEGRDLTPEGVRAYASKLVAEHGRLRAAIETAIGMLGAASIEQIVGLLQASLDPPLHPIRPDLPDTAEIFVRAAIEIVMPGEARITGSNFVTFKMGDVRAYGDPASRVDEWIRERQDTLRAGAVERIVTTPNARILSGEADADVSRT